MNEPIKELISLNREYLHLGNRGLQVYLRMGQILTEQRPKFPPRKGWLAFLKEADIPQQRASEGMKLWARRALILPFIGSIGVVEALRLTRKDPEAKPKPKQKAARAKVHAFNQKELSIIRKGLDPVVPESEARNAAWMFFQSLRKRKASYYDLFNEKLN
jgi:hypothetical protein